eukprot:6177094-Pleurochrysis_carterae.AAC.2
MVEDIRGTSAGNLCLARATRGYQINFQSRGLACSAASVELARYGRRRASDVEYVITLICRSAKYVLSASLRPKENKILFSARWDFVNWVEGPRQQCTQEKAEKLKAESKQDRKPRRRERSSPAERQVYMKLTAAHAT